MESEAASSFDRIHSVLKELETQCLAEGQAERERQVFEAEIEYVKLADSVCDDIQQLGTDWVFLIMYYESVDKWRNADDQEEQESCIQTIASAARDLSIACQPKKETLYSRKDLKLLKVLISGCQTKTEHLMVEIEATVSSWSGGCSFLEVYVEENFIVDYFSNLNLYSRLKKLLESVLVSLQIIIKETALHGVSDAGDVILSKQSFAFYNDLKYVQKYFGGFHEGNISSNCFCYGIREFLASVASVAINTAHCSCKYWLNKKIDPIVAWRNLISGLVDVQHRIGPTNPNFVMLNLEFLRTLAQISRTPTSILVTDVCPYFLMNWVNKKDLEKEVDSLVDLVIGVIFLRLEDCQTWKYSN